MTRISWADPSLSGGLFEKIVACLFGNEHPNSVRIRPSQGDKGVDIYNPVGQDEIDVYQVKYYPTQVHWTKIRGSLERLREGTWNGRTVRRWYLVIPKQPTDYQDVKLRELVGDIWDTPPFTTGWFGEDRLVQMAADHPEVGNYYLGDGREQLERIATDWDSCLTRLGRGESPRIEDAEERLTQIAEALGRNDPHFEYGFDVQPIGRDPGVILRPGAVGVSSCKVDRYRVSLTTFLKYRGAEEDAKAEGRLHIQLNLTSEAGQRVTGALATGSEDADLDSADILSYSLPTFGHQAPADAEISARILRRPDTTPAHIRVGLKPPSGPRAIASFTRQQITSGWEGATSQWASPQGFFNLTLIVRNHSSLQVTIEPTGPTQGPISAISEEIRFLRALRDGVTFELFRHRGPLEPFAKGPIDSSGTGLSDEAIWMLDALRVIQDHTHTEVVIPDDFNRRNLTEIVALASLLEGLTVVNHMTEETAIAPLPRELLTPGSSHDVFSQEFSLAYPATPDADVALPHQAVSIAEELIFVRVFRSCRVASVLEDNPNETTVTVRLEPVRSPLVISHRISHIDDFTDELHQELLSLTNETNTINTSHLGPELARRGSQPST